MASALKNAHTGTNKRDTRGAVVISILPFLKGTAFSPEVTRIMGEAFERATRDLHDRGQPAVVQEILAKRIIDLAAWGERDPEIIASKALDSVGIRSSERSVADYRR
jgi:hypothetical protein